MPQATNLTSEAIEPAGFAPGWRERFKHAPLVLQAYIVFVIAAIAFSFAALFVRPLGNAVLPIIGGTGGVNLGFTLYFAIVAALGQGRMVLAVVALLALFALFGGWETVRHLAAPTATAVYSANSALRYHDLRPAFTVVLPVCWILLLLSPAMWRWMRRDQRVRAYQFSLSDLLYLMLVVCLGLAASLALASLMHRVGERVERPNVPGFFLPAKP
jgi:hypothetical protein